MKQCVRLAFGIENAEERINTIVKDMNEKGWKLTQIVSHYSRQTNWCMVFQKISKN